MAYGSKLQVAEYTGLATQVLDENVGTGDNSETDFSLDNKNTVNGTLTLSYASSSTNDRTALTETTHYTVNYDEGLIVLEAAGVTALGTNVLYAKYRHWTDELNNSMVDNLIASADDEVDLLTGRTWDGPTSKTEYHDGERIKDYPMSDRPYDATNYRDPESLMLNNQQITQITAIYFLQRPISISQFFNFDDNTSTYTDFTDNVNDTSESDFTLFAATPATDDIVYIGSTQKFLGLTVGLSTVGTGSPALDWEYYDGSTWSDLTETDVDTGASTFTASGSFTWDMPSSWTKTSVNSSDDLFYVRAKVSTGYTVAPICNSVTLYDAVMEQIHLRDIIFEKWGKLSFINKRVPNGLKNVRIDYSYGQTSTPSLISELSSILSGIRAYTHITGGSFDAISSFSIGSKTFTQGEQYVNVREVLDQFRKRVNEILDLYGRRADVVAI